MACIKRSKESQGSKNKLENGSKDPKKQFKLSARLTVKIQKCND